MAARAESAGNLEYFKNVSRMQPYVVQKFKPSSDVRDLTVLVAGTILPHQVIYGMKGSHLGQTLTQLFTVGNAEMFFDVSAYAKDDSRFISPTEAQQGKLEKWVKDGRNAVMALFVRQFGALATMKAFELQHVPVDDESRSFTVREFTELEEVASKIARVVKKLKIELRRLQINSRVAKAKHEASLFLTPQKQATPATTPKTARRNLAKFFSPPKSGEPADDEQGSFKPVRVKISVSPIMDAFDRDRLFEELERDFFHFDSRDQGLCLVDSVELSVAEVAREINPEAFENVVTTDAIWNAVIACSVKGRYNLKPPSLASEFPLLDKEIQVLHQCEHIEQLDRDTFNAFYEAMKV